MEILKATVGDAAEILSLQKLAYLTEAEIYGNYDILPLKQSIEEIEKQFEDHIFLKAVSGGGIIGSVRAREKNGTAYIGMLAVHPDYRNRGVATAIMKAVEGLFPSLRFELFTGSKSYKNIRLYEKSGYTVFKTKGYGIGDIEIVYMEKKSTPTP